MWSVDMAVDPVPGSTEPVFSAIARQTAVLLVVISKPKARLSYPERPTMSEGRSEQRGAINLAEFSEAASNVALGARVARGEKATPFSPALHAPRGKQAQNALFLRAPPPLLRSHWCGQAGLSAVGKCDGIGPADAIGECEANLAVGCSYIRPLSRDCGE